MTANTIPTSGQELEAMLADSTKLAEVAKTPASLGEFIRNYATSQMEKQGEHLSAQIREQSQIVMAEMLKANGSALKGRPDVSNSTRKAHGYSETAPGVALDGEFKNMSDFLASVRPDSGRGARSQEQRNKWERIRNDYSTVDPSLGGFLVPEVLRSELLQATLEAAIVRPRAMVVDMDSASVPFPTVDDTSHATSLYGGITGTWVAEGEALPESEAKFGRVVLRANKLVSYCEAPAELVQDAGSTWSSFINQSMPRAIAFFEDQAFLTGNGTGRPLGVLNAGNTALVAVAKETNQASASIVWENIVKMYARMLPSSLGSAVWIASIDSFPELATMALTVGTAGSAVWLNNGVTGPPMTILGRPVIFTEKAATVGAQGDIAFVDFSQYLIGQKNELRVESSSHYKFGNDLVAYRVIERVDGRPWLKSAITPANGSSATLSPYVALAVR